LLPTQCAVMCAPSSPTERSSTLTLLQNPFLAGASMNTQLALGSSVILMAAAWRTPRWSGVLRSTHATTLSNFIAMSRLVVKLETSGPLTLLRSGAFPCVLASRRNGAEFAILRIVSSWGICRTWQPLQQFSTQLFSTL
jgi:hypothetical protein